jgi:uncharacterized membrane protein YqhA
MEKLRYVSIVAVIFSFLGSLLMFLIGAAKSIKAFRIYFLKESLTTDPAPPGRLDFAEQTMLATVESVDGFLLGLVLLIFSFGIYGLFIGEVKVPKNIKNAPWAQITSIERLKQVLVEVIIVLLAVIFLWEVLFQAEQVTWDILVLPIGIALLALALRLVEWRS